MIAVRIENESDAAFMEVMRTTIGRTAWPVIPPGGHDTWWRFYFPHDAGRHLVTVRARTLNGERAMYVSVHETVFGADYLAAARGLEATYPLYEHDSPALVRDLESLREKARGDVRNVAVVLTAPLYVSPVEATGILLAVADRIYFILRK